MASFTGYTTGWVNYTSLIPSSYYGDTIRIRFRLRTDASVVKAVFIFIKTLISDNITDTFYNITGKNPGTYFYVARSIEIPPTGKARNQILKIYKFFIF